MDTKRMITGMMLAMLVILGYNFFISWLWKKNNWTPPGANAPTTQVVEAPAPGTSPSTAPSLTTAPTTIAASGSAMGLRVVSATAPAQSIALGSAAEKDASYALQ